MYTSSANDYNGAGVTILDVEDDNTAKILKSFTVKWVIWQCDNCEEENTNSLQPGTHSVTCKHCEKLNKLPDNVEQ